MATQCHAVLGFGTWNRKWTLVEKTGEIQRDIRIQLIEMHQGQLLSFDEYITTKSG